MRKGKKLLFGILCCVFVLGLVIPISLPGIAIASTKSVAHNMLTSVNAESESILSPPTTEWNKTFGTSSGERAYDVCQTNDGGYIVTGVTGINFLFTDSYSSAGDLWLMKIDASGNKQWEKTFGGSNLNMGYCVKQTTDGGYIISGVTNAYGFNWGDAPSYGDVWLIKTDALGNKEWDKVFGGSNYDEARSVCQTSDGGFILGGGTRSYTAGWFDVWLIKTDGYGNEQWSKNFGGWDGDCGYSVRQDNDGGYVVLGYTYNYGAGLTDIWLIKTDASGNKVWDKTYGGSSGDGGCDFKQTSDGGYIIVGGTSSFGSGGGDAWLLKTDSSGTKQWDKTFGGSGDETGFSIDLTNDGGYIFVGWTTSFGSGVNDIYVVKTDSNGNEVWHQTYGGSGDDFGLAIQETTDGGYIVAGLTTSFGSGGEDAWLIKLAPPASGVGRIVLTGALNISPPGPYSVGDTLTATFTVENKGDAAITLDKLLLGGRYNGGELPGGGYPDFTYQMVNLQPGQSHQYQGTFTIPEPGDYGFFIAYYIENPTEAERAFLDVNNWNTCIELGEGLTDADRTRQITVAPTPPNQTPVAFFNLSPNRTLLSGEAVYFSASGSYDPDGAIISYDWDFGDGSKAVGISVNHRYRGAVNQSRTYSVTLTVQDNGGATANYSREVEVTPLTKVVQVTHQPPIGESSVALMRTTYNWIHDDTYVVSRVQYECLGFIGIACISIWDCHSHTLPIPRWSTDIICLGRHILGTYYPVLEQIQYGGDVFEGVAVSSTDAMSVYIGGWDGISISIGPSIPAPFFVINSDCFEPSGANPPTIPAEMPTFGMIHLFSPGELRIYDSQGQCTGLVNGEVIQEISNSAYADETAILLMPFGSYRYQVAGTDTGLYGLTIVHILGGDYLSFIASNISITSGAVHQYTIDWDALSQGEKGVTLQIDSDGDGVFEQTVTSDATLELPQVESITAPVQPVPVNTNIDVKGSFTDAGLLDTHTAEWDWGDGSISDGAVTESNGSGNVTGSYTYNCPGVYTITLSVIDDDGDVGTATATVTVTPQSMKVFVIKNFAIQWASHKPGWQGSDWFSMFGRLQLPQGYTWASLEKQAIVTISIADKSGNDRVLFKGQLVGRTQSALWVYKGSEQPPGEGINITNMVIWWPPQGTKWAGWGGFYIGGVLQLPEPIGINTTPANVKVTLEIPLTTAAGCGSLMGEQTVPCKVYKPWNLWTYNVWPNLSTFPYDPTGRE